MNASFNALRTSLADPWAGSMAAILSAATIVGYSFDINDSAAGFLGANAIPSALAWIALALLLHVAIVLVFKALDLSSTTAARMPVSSERFLARLRRSGPALWAILVIAWLPWTILHAPGLLDPDTFTQRFQWLGLMERTDHHPWFDTTVFGFVWDAAAALTSEGGGLFTLILVQILATTAGFAVTLVYLLHRGVRPLLVGSLLAVIAVHPVFTTAAAVLSKDSFAGWFWLPFLVLFVEALRTRGAVLQTSWVAVAALAVMIPLVMAKRTNVYLLVICAVVLLIVAQRGKRRRIVVGSSAVLLLTQLIWPSLVLPALGVGPGTSVDMLTIPVQQTARVSAEHGNDIPTDEREVIDSVLRWDGLGDAYDPRRSDAVKGRWNLDAGLSDQAAYVRVWVAQAFRYPGTYLAATASNTYEYFAPMTPMLFHNELSLDRYVEYWDARTPPSTSRATVEAVVASVQHPGWLADAREAANTFSRTFLEKDPFSTKAFYASWIPFVAVMYGLRSRRWLLVASAVPLLVMLAFLVASPVALPRYILPSLYGSVLISGLAASRGDFASRRINAT